MDHRIALPNGRSLSLSDDQLRRIAQGLGNPFDAPLGNGRASPIVEALGALPADQRADALAVVLSRFAEKQDLETISHSRGLSPWRVWQLEEAFRRALAEAQAAHRARIEADLVEELESSETARVMSADMLANAIAHGKPVDLDREHEASLIAARKARSS